MTVTGSLDGGSLPLEAAITESGFEQLLATLDAELVGLAPVKTRIREIASLLLIEKLRGQVGLSAGAPSLHMSFTGNPGTGKTTVALRMAGILHALGYVRKGHLVAATRDDLVGQFIGHTAPKTKEVLKRAMGGVLFIDEAYFLYRPENERDYGQEAIEILLQVMENQRDDLVVILAGYRDRMERFFQSNPGMSSRIAHHVDFPDYTPEELLQIAGLMLEKMQYRLSPEGEAALVEYIALRRAQPNFANARSNSQRPRPCPAAPGQPPGRRPRRPPHAAGTHVDRGRRRPRQPGLPRGERRARAGGPGRHAASGRRRHPMSPVSMRIGETTLTEYLIVEQRKIANATGSFTALVNDIRLACTRIAFLVGKGALAGALGKTGSANVHGEEQATLDVLANHTFIRATEWGGSLAGMVSEELDEPHSIPAEFTRGHYLLAFDPLDGSSNIDVNAPVGSIFSVLRAPLDATAPDGVAEPTAAAFLQPGSRQVCAGYAIYGPSTMLVLTLGHGVDGFTFDRELGEFILTHPNLRISEETSEFAINSSNARFWEPAVARYVSECLAGKSGVRDRDFGMRWVASLVADAHRILMRGGVFLYPRDTREHGRRGKIRLLYEANPIGFLVEQAGGRASTGFGPVLDVQPRDIHERTGFVFGARAEVERLERYHRDHNEVPFDAPLFGSRGLFLDSR